MTPLLAWVGLALLGLAGACGGRGEVAPPAPGTVPTAGAAAAPEPSERRQTVAVYPFDNNAVSGRERLAFLAEWLPDVVGAELRERSGLRLVERRELLRLLAEQKLGATELAARETRLRLGRIAGAQTLVFGGFAAVGEELWIDARLVDAETGAVLRSATVRGPAAEARRLGQELAEAVARDLGLEASRRAAAAGLLDDRSLRAAELFYEGLALEKRGEVDGAVERYRQVLELDRNDEEARRRLKGLLGKR